jgi:hypothetical protein
MILDKIFKKSTTDKLKNIKTSLAFRPKYLDFFIFQMGLLQRINPKYIMPNTLSEITKANSMSSKSNSESYSEISIHEPSKIWNAHFESGSKQIPHFKKRDKGGEDALALDKK